MKWWKLKLKTKNWSEVYYSDLLENLIHWKKDYIGSPKFLIHPWLHIQIYSFLSPCLPGSTGPGSRGIIRVPSKLYVQDIIVVNSIIYFQDHYGYVMSRIYRISLPRIWIYLLPWDIILSVHGISLPRIWIDLLPRDSAPRA